MALRDFVSSNDIPASTEWFAQPSVSRWARLRLPTGQVARSFWQEQEKPLNKLQAPYAVSPGPVNNAMHAHDRIPLRHACRGRANQGAVFSLNLVLCLTPTLTVGWEGQVRSVTYTASMFPAVGGATGDQVHGRPPNGQ